MNFRESRLAYFLSPHDSRRLQRSSIFEKKKQPETVQWVSLKKQKRDRVRELIGTVLKAPFQLAGKGAVKTLDGVGGVTISTGEKIKKWFGGIKKKKPIRRPRPDDSLDRNGTNPSPEQEAITENQETLATMEQFRSFLLNPTPFHILEIENKARDAVMQENIATIAALQKHMNPSPSHKEAQTLLASLDARNITNGTTVLPPAQHKPFREQAPQNPLYSNNDFLQSDKTTYVEGLNEYLNEYLNTPEKGVTLTDYENTNLPIETLIQIFEYLESNMERRHANSSRRLEDIYKEMLHNSINNDTMNAYPVSLSPEQMASLEYLKSQIAILEKSIQTMNDGPAKDSEALKMRKAQAMVSAIETQLQNQ